VRAVVDGSGAIKQKSNYYPFGMTFAQTGSPDNMYLYNGKEKQEGTHWLDYGARMYASELGRWMCVDPMAEKFVDWNPYNYCFNNPILYIDPDGHEGIVVSGQPGDHKNKRHFLENGLDRAKTLNKQYKKDGNREKATWIVYNGGGKGGYDKKTIAAYQNKADKAGVAMKVVSSAHEIVDYVNEKSGGETRSEDLVSNFIYIGHATPGDLDVGFEDHGTWNIMTNETLDVGEFNKEAFSNNSNANIVGGCRTAVSGNLLGERSVAEQIADKVGGVVSDKALVGKNNGKIIIIQGRNRKNKMLKKIIISVSCIILLFYIGGIIIGHTIVLNISDSKDRTDGFSNDSIVNPFEQLDFKSGDWEMYIVLSREDRKKTPFETPRTNCYKSKDDRLFIAIKNNWRFKKAQGDMSTVESNMYLLKDGVLVFESGILLGKNIEGLQSSNYGWIEARNKCLSDTFKYFDRVYSPIIIIR